MLHSLVESACPNTIVQPTLLPPSPSRVPRNHSYKLLPLVGCQFPKWEYNHGANAHFADGFESMPTQALSPMSLLQAPSGLSSAGSGTRKMWLKSLSPESHSKHGTKKVDPKPMQRTKKAAAAIYGWDRSLHLPAF